MLLVCSACKEEDPLKLCCSSLCFVLFSAQLQASVLAQCSQQSEGHQALTRCLEQAYQQAEQQLQSVENQVQNNMAELDAISSADIGAEAFFLQSQAAFRQWREQQCLFIRASYGLGNGADQGYLDCLQTLTVEQKERLHDYSK